MDINQDGHPDLLSFAENNGLYLYYGNGTPNEWFNFNDRKKVSLKDFYGNYTHHLSGDIDGDGLKGILSFTTEGELLVLLGKTLKEYLQTPSNIAPMERVKQLSAPVKKLDATFNPAQLQLHDMNNDKRSDLVVIDDEGNYAISYGQDDGLFSTPEDHTTAQENGEQVSYVPNRFPRHVQSKHIDSTNDTRILKILQGIIQGSGGHPAVLSLNNAGELYFDNFNRLRLKDTIAYYVLGEGNDSIITRQDRRIQVDVDAGVKNITTGPYDDSFLLKGKPAQSTPSHLNGGEGQDTMIAVVKPEAGGYEIDLQSGYVRYTVTEDKIAQLSAIR